MKIVVITNGFQLDYEINFSNALISSVDDLYLIGGDNYEMNKLNPKINFLNLRGSHDESSSTLEKIIRLLKYYYKLIRFIASSKATFIHVLWLRFSFIDGILMTILFRTFGKKCIYTVHDVVPHDRDTMVNRLVFSIIYRLQDILVVHTNFIKSRLITEFNIRDDKITIFKHGVYKVNETPEITPLTARRELGIEELDFVILFYGSIAKYKGVDLLFDVFSLLEKQYPKKVKLIVAGKVHHSYNKIFESIINSIKLSNVLIFQGYQNDLKTEKLFKTADITILPYYEASQSGVLFLSFAFGVPVIAPDLGGFRYDILEGKTGLLFNTGDPQSLYNSIAKVINNIGSKDSFNKRFIKNYTSLNYSWEAECKKLINFCCTKLLS